jgi:hypothetical protein
MVSDANVGGCVPGRGPPYRRGAILDHVGQEQVGCWWLSAITLHSVIMPPPAAASNLNSSLGSFLRAGGRTQPKNNLEHAGHSSGAKVPTRVACLPDGGLGAGSVRRTFSPLPSLVTLTVASALCAKLCPPEITNKILIHRLRHIALRLSCLSRSKYLRWMCFDYSVWAKAVQEVHHPRSPNPDMLLQLVTHS